LLDGTAEDGCPYAIFTKKNAIQRGWIAF